MLTNALNNRLTRYKKNNVDLLLLVGYQLSRMNVLVRLKPRVQILLARFEFAKGLDLNFGNPTEFARKIFFSLIHKNWYSQYKC